jgi:DNA-binding GntR family transcriptional regulator
VVAELDVRDLAEVYRLRELLEAEAVRVALPRVTDADIDRIAALFEQVASAGTISDAMKANRRAHFVLFEAARLPFLLRHIAMLWDSTEAYRALYYSTTSVDDEHREIVAALSERDAERVLALLNAHRRHALVALTAALDPQRDGSVAS